MVKVNEECCGCGACVQKCPQKCISMVASEEGFLYPHVDAGRCIQCGVCENVCPINMPKPVHDAQKRVYVGYSRDTEERNASSSGGVFSLLAAEVLRSGGLVFGAAFDERFDVHHIGIANSEQLDMLRRSKYVQSNTDRTYQEAKEILETGRMVLYSGTPCQIAGLKSFLGKDYPLLYTVDLICHGVPSPRLWRKYAEELCGRYASTIQAVSFRNKDTGWKEFSIRIEFENGTKYTSTFPLDPYMQMFLRNICLRSSCYVCPFKGKSYYSDLTLGDAWGIGKKNPLSDDDRGTSAVVVHTPKGDALMSLIAGKWTGEVLAYDVGAENDAYLKPAAEHPRRKEFIRGMNSNANMKQLERLTQRRIIDRAISKIKKIKQTIFPCNSKENIV